jgi:hypothetical protein
MSFSVDWENRIVDSTSSITDIPAAREQLRALEDSVVGILYPPIIAYKQVALGGGALFPAIAFINGYKLRFPAPGNYEIRGGNLLAEVVPVEGVFVDRTQSAAYAVTAEGGGESIFDEEIESNLSFKAIQRLMAAILVGKTEIDLGPPVVVTFKAANGSKVRVQATMSGSERQSVSLDGS